MMPAMGYRVFISHASKDRWIARQVARAIEVGSSGRVTTFLDDKDIDVGARIRETIRRELQGCDALVVLYSSAAAQRDWVKAEIGAAWVLGKPIHVLLDKIDSRELPDVVSDFKPFDLNDIDRYVEAINAVLDSVTP